MAARYGDARVIRSAASQLTQETRMYLEWQEPYTGRTALLEAAAKGHCECARILIEAGANCNAKDLKMNTALHLACKRAQFEMVKLLLEIPAVTAFEINLYMKSPLDLARSRFSGEEAEDKAQGYAKCIELLEKSFYLYSGWLYEKTDNVLSYISGMSSLHSWTRRLCVVLERGDPSVLELAFFSKSKDGVRPVCPTSVMLYNVASGSEVTNDPRWFSPKAFTFNLRGDHLNQCHYKATSDLQKPIHFAALDQSSFDGWMNFFANQQEQLSGQVHPNRSFERRQFSAHHSNSAGCNPFAMPSALLSSVSSTNSFEEAESIRRATKLSLHTAAQRQNAHGASDAPPLPVLPVSAPDWTLCENCDLYREDELIVAAIESNDQSKTLPSRDCSDQSVAPVDECVVCFDGLQLAVCVPCGHNAVCMKCAEEVLSTTAECPVCRAHIREFIKLYRV